MHISNANLFYHKTDEFKREKLNYILCFCGEGYIIYDALTKNARKVDYMDKYDLIALDMDGTLLTSELNISEETKAAIDKAVRSGKTVVLSTGRAPSEIIEYEEQLKNIRYYVCENGALLYDSWEKRAIYSQSFPQDIAEKLIKIAEIRDVMIYVVSNGRHMCTYKDVLRMGYFQIDQFQEFVLRTAVLHDDIIASYHREAFPIEKINFFSVSKESREELKNILEKLPLTAVYAEETSLEVSPLHMSKAVGLQRLCDYLSIPIRKVIAVGDSDNDSEMLKIAGLSVAMGNARQNIKELCDVVVADNNHDGCAEAIERYLLECV